ncbi:hypothetical protein EUZ85_03170 [Hahella sp. KA22]|uniref:hypothetical protein n=1 Tax=Hahella sp. KA22 TaxID=1628392 RepID=UPI000FDF3EA2|nr:hypothetical protein [Hahella sp. KA22]AZZ89761.1 hypothetical protein ENC22_00625 [Hahella sp. KA22]QAY53131.1 hypothetical protein EUZ85_03170 [Hahella sp. KA22]
MKPRRHPLWILRIARGSAVLLALLLSCSALAAPDGWEVLVENGEELFIPGDLKADEEYCLFLSVAEDVPQSEYRGWFERVLKEDGGKLGEVIDTLAVKESKGGVLSSTVMMQTEGKARFVHYMAFYGKGKAVYMRIFASDGAKLVSRYSAGMQQVMKENLPLRLKGVATQSGAATPAQPVTTQKSAPSLPASTKSADATKKTDIQKVDNGALPRYSLPNNYEALVCDYTAGISNSNYKVDNFVYLLFKDGSAYKRLTVPPEDFGVAKARKDDPKNWGVWKKNGDGYKVKVGGDWRELKRSDLLEPARIGERLNRYIYIMNAHGMAGISPTTSVYTNSWTFHGSGRFTKGSSSLHGSGGAASALTGTSVYASSKSDEHGDSSVAGGIAPGMVTSTTRENKDGAKNRGAYQLNGYAMNLSFDNGEKQRMLFGFCHGDRTDPFLGGTQYWMKESEAERDLPTDWKMVITENEDQFYVPGDLKEGEVFRLVISPKVELNGRSMEDWFKETVTQNLSYLGDPLLSPNWTSQQGLHQYYNAFKENGRDLYVVYYGMKTRGRFGRFARLVMSDSAMAQRYAKELQPALKEAFRQ